MSTADDLATQAAEVLAPAKVLRLATMIDSIVEELRSRPVDGETRARVRVMYGDFLIEVGSALSDPLLEELARFHPSAGATTDDVLRVDLVLLAGWLRGLRDGLAAAEVPYDLSAQPEPTAA